MVKTIWLFTAMLCDIAMFIWFMHTWANLILDNIIVGVLLGWALSPVLIAVRHPIIALSWVAFMEVTSRMWKP